MRSGRGGSTSRRHLAVLGALSFVAVATAGKLAHASTLDAHGHLIFDSDAVFTSGFESLPAQGEGASWLAWNTDGSVFTAAAASDGSWVSSAGAPGTVALPDALEGGHALKLTSGSNVAFAFADPSLFNSLATRRVQISFWGFSMGAEPELDVLYPSVGAPFGPYADARVVAVPTGRETSDGWAEYSTGPVDGTVFGADLIGAIVLSARFATQSGTFALDDYHFDPASDVDTIQDPNAYALLDAIEVEPLAGAPMPVTPCTQATVATACGPLAECNFGHCIDGSVVWGSVPQATAHRADLLNRWAFIGEHLSGDRKSAANASTVFSSAAVSAVTASTAAPGFYGGLNTLVNSLRDGHTGLGFATSSGSLFGIGYNPDDSYSGPLDICLGLAQDDLPGGTGGSTYAVFWMAPDSAVGSALGGALSPGDMLTQIDGLTPDAWLDTVGPRFRDTLPNDPKAEPSGRAVLLANAIGQYATTAVFSSCSAAGTCTTKTVHVADLTYPLAIGTGNPDATMNSRPCSGRFTDSVSTWQPVDDEATTDTPAFESAGGIATVEFDGFEGTTEPTNPADLYRPWEAPMEQALTSGQGILFDARLGRGGLPNLGDYLTDQIRGTPSPYYSFAVPRGTWDNADPTWLFDPSLAACVNGSWWDPDLCGWTSGGLDAPTLSTPPAAGVKIAWVNGIDVSMNDMVPRDLLGAANIRIFGPHPTTGAYGQISLIPSMVAGWSPGSIQVLDTRFGSSFATAVAAPWASGTGVAPDEVVLQKVSDILAGTDTVLTAARAWLNQ
jgi:hypothetical protein